LADAGATVTICGRRRQQLDAMAARHENIHAEGAPLNDHKTIAQLYNRGPFDIVVANAGGAESPPAEKISAELWTKTLNVNLTGAFYSVQPALNGMRRKKWHPTV